MTQLEDDEIIKMKRGLGWIDLKEAIKAEGCPICYIMNKSLMRYFENLLHEFALDVAVHKKMIAAMGMCNIHTWVFAEFSDKLGIASLFETTLHKEIKLLKRTSELGKNELPDDFKNKKKLEKHKKLINEQLSPKGYCLSCEHQRESESFYTHEILTLWSDDQFRKYYEKDDLLLCRSHFLFLVEECERKEIIDYYLATQRSKLDKINFQFSEFLRKHDYRFQNEMTDENRKSLTKVLEYFGSKKNIEREGYNDSQLNKR
jgi:hypothetical protein